MSERPRPVAALIKIAVIVGILFGLSGVVVGPYMAQKISTELTAHFNQSMTIGNARFSILGPVLTLEKVVFNNPPEYAQQSAIEIERVVVVFGDYGMNPIRINSITFNGMASTVKFIQGTDNLLAVKRVLNARNKMMPQGIWAKPTIIESVQIRHASLKSDLTAAAVKDANLDPIGSEAQPIMLENAIINALSNTIQDQRYGIPALVMQGATQSLSGAVNSVVRVLQDARE